MTVDWHPGAIVVGVDGSESSERAAATGVAIARQWQSTLTFVTVVRPPEGWWGIVGSPPTPAAVGDAIADAQRDVVESTLATLDLEGIEYSVETEIGDPTKELLAACQEQSADLLIIGKRGAGLLERVMLGSVATRVSNHAATPVLIIP